MAKKRGRVAESLLRYLIRELGARGFRQIRDPNFATSDRQKRKLELIEQGADIPVADHCALVDLELSGNAVDPGFEVHEVDRIGGGQRDGLRLRKIDVGQRKRDGQRDRLSRGVGELIAHGHAQRSRVSFLAVRARVPERHTGGAGLLLRLLRLPTLVHTRSGNAKYLN